MSWIQKLYETYENCQSMVGRVSSENEVPLLPICHTTNKAQIEIVIDHQGNFKRARIVPKEDARTIIPCTESSGGRTSGGTPHPLCDKLQYVADDYGKFGGDKRAFFKLDPADYTKNDFKNEYFKTECKNSQYHLINEMLAIHEKKLNVCELLNWLIKIPNLTQLLSDNGGISDVQTKTADTATRVSNKYKLIDIFPLTLEKTITYAYLLGKWCQSSFANTKATAVLEYVKKGCVVKDLIDEKVLFIGSDGKLLRQRDGKKENKNVSDVFDVLPGRLNKKGEIENWQADAFIRWEIETPDNNCSKVWEDKTLWDSWINYYSSIKQEKVLCYVTGKERLGAEQHPAKLRNDGDKAKLISSNDLSGFTFRGRFTDTQQVCGVGFEVTQKAHSSLRWLISRQGYRSGDQAIVSWATSGREIPDPLADPLSVLGEDELVSDYSDIVSTAQNIALKFNKKIAGYKTDLGDTSGVVVMGLDSATPGRMAITYYRELTGADFLKMVEHWHETCAWVHDYRSIEDKNNKKAKRQYLRFIGAPAPRDIAEAAYGRNIDDNLKKATVERLLPCIIDGQQIPRDIVESAVRRACNRIGMEDWESNKTLSIACALFRKLNEKEGYGMALDESRKTRDYLYGRLLALADSLEQWALNKAREDRQTNAARMMQRFAEHPYSTWRTLELSLSPYKARLGAQSHKRQEMIDEVKNMFNTEEFMSDKKLSGEFLLAYSCQREALRPKGNNNANENDTELIAETDQ